MRMLSKVLLKATPGDTRTARTQSRPQLRSSSFYAKYFKWLPKMMAAESERASGLIWEAVSILSRNQSSGESWASLVHDTTLVYRNTRAWTMAYLNSTARLFRKSKRGYCSHVVDLQCRKRRRQSLFLSLRLCTPFGNPNKTNRAFGPQIFLELAESTDVISDPKVSAKRLRERLECSTKENIVEPFVQTGGASTESFVALWRGAFALFWPRAGGVTARRPPSPTHFTPPFFPFQNPIYE